MLILSLWYFLQQKIETLSHKDKNLLLLVEMGFSTEEAASAVDRCGVYLPFSVTFVFSFAHFHWQTVQKKNIFTGIMFKCLFSYSFIYNWYNVDLLWTIRLQDMICYCILLCFCLYCNNNCYFYTLYISNCFHPCIFTIHLLLLREFIPTAVNIVYISDWSQQQPIISVFGNSGPR